MDYEPKTGALRTVVRNADPAEAVAGDASTELVSADYAGVSITGWGRFTSGVDESLTTSMTHDLLGRTTASFGPSGAASYVRRELRAASVSAAERPRILYSATVSLPQRVTRGVVVGGNTVSSAFDGPARVSLTDAAGKTVESSAWTVSTTGYDPANGAYTLVSEIARSTIQHRLSGLVQSRKVWHDVAGNRADTTAYDYDALGRLLSVTNPNNSVTKYSSYDVRDRALAVQAGKVGQTFYTVAEYFYDDSDLSNGPHQGLRGNGNLNYVRVYTGDDTFGGLTAAHRDTRVTFDWRDRPVITRHAAAPHRAVAYDNLDRPVGQAVFSAEPTAINAPLADRGTYQETSYSQRGLVYRDATATNPTSSSPSFLQTASWFDASGRTIASWSPNGPGTKIDYDGHGRAKTVFTTDRAGDAAPGSGSHADADDRTGDNVLEQTEHAYQLGTGRLQHVTTRLRFHDSTATGDLTGSNSVASYVGYQYDEADRAIRTIDFGSNTGAELATGGTLPGDWPLASTLLEPGTAQTGYTDALISAARFDDRGMVRDTLDPAGKVTRALYDDRGRTIASIENYKDATLTWNGTSQRWVAGNLSASVRDEDRVTSYVYDPAGNLKLQAAHLQTGAGETAQITQYTYGTTAGAYTTSTNSLLNFGDLLREVTYPDSESVAYAYNRLGELRAVTDQNGTEHEYSRDSLGRVTRDEASVAGNIDPRINVITAAYDALGRLSRVESLASGAIANWAEFGYTALWQVETLEQDPDGDGDLPSATVGYDYGGASITGNYSRPYTVEYPDQGDVTVVEFGYASGVDDRISRPSEMFIQSTGAQLVSYRYLGLGMPAVTDYGRADLQLDRTLGHDGKRRNGGFTTQTAGHYPGWDRFGRVARQAWVDGVLTQHASISGLPSRPPIFEQTHTYDAASNRLTAYDARPGAAVPDRDWRHTYDGLDRLTQSLRGASTGAGWVGALGGQKWGLDALGNWDSFEEDLAGAAGTFGETGDALEDRSHDLVNQLTQTVNGAATLPFAYDDAGNMARAQLDTDPSGEDRGYVHDAWNRLVRVERLDRSTGAVIATLAEYEYNGLHWRTIKRADTDYPPDGSLDQQRVMHYDASWRLLEEDVDDGWSSGHATDRVAQQFWGLRYLDDAVARRVRADGESSRSDWVWRTPS